jgi:hypothetical protein
VTEGRAPLVCFAFGTKALFGTYPYFLSAQNVHSHASGSSQVVPFKLSQNTASKDLFLYKITSIIYPDPSITTMIPHGADPSECKQSLGICAIFNCRKLRKLRFERSWSPASLGVVHTRHELDAWRWWKIILKEDFSQFLLCYWNLRQHCNPFLLPPLRNRRKALRYGLRCGQTTLWHLKGLSSGCQDWSRGRQYILLIFVRRWRLMSSKSRFSCSGLTFGSANFAPLPSDFTPQAEFCASFTFSSFLGRRVWSALRSLLIWTRFCLVETF